jgi:hypothetical protein
MKSEDFSVWLSGISGMSAADGMGTAGPKFFFGKSGVTH